MSLRALIFLSGRRGARRPPELELVYVEDSPGNRVVLAIDCRPRTRTEEKGKRALRGTGGPTNGRGGPAEVGVGGGQL